MATEKAMFAAGCFWGVEARLSELNGVRETVVGYAGGAVDHPNYKDVCAGGTGHAEVVEVTYDPARISYDSLLDAFFSLHDPTTLNRQGPDWGSQYRSAIFTYNSQQENAARSRIAELNASGSFRRPVVTEVVPRSQFWKAEEYHQKYLEKRGMVGCHI